MAEVDPRIMGTETEGPTEATSSPPGDEPKKSPLECSRCGMTPLLEPIYTCDSGHAMCEGCVPDLKCSSDCGHEMRRNRVIELITAGVSIPCYNSAQGCHSLVKGALYHEHLENCNFKNVECHEWEVIKCHGTKVPLAGYFPHLRDVHQIQGFNLIAPEGVLTMSEYTNSLSTDNDWPTYYMTLEDDKVFLRNMKTENSTLYIWFTMIGTVGESKAYKAIVTIYMKHSEESKVQWTLPIYSVQKSKDLEPYIFRLGIPTQLLHLYCTERQHPYGEYFKYVFDLQYEIISV